MIDANHLCPNCMKSWEDTTMPCPHCGFAWQAVESGGRELPPFTILAGRYLLGTRLGAGGFGIIYIAMDLVKEQTVAIKEFFPVSLARRSGEQVEPLPDEDGRYFREAHRSFRKEAELLSRFIDVKGIVPYRDFLQENGTSYLVMDYIEGINLRQYMRQSGKTFSQEKALELMRPILLAADTMHQQNVLHRDISPENLIRKPDGTLTLIDFGAAREFHLDGEENLTVILKHGYAPEEQYHTGSHQGPWTDLYACCAVLYQMISGILPQDAASRRQKDDLCPLDEIEGITVTPAFARAIEKGLTIQATERYPSIRKLMADLYPASEAKADTNTSAPSNKSGKDPKAEQGADQEAEQGAKQGIEQGAEQGAKPGSEPGSKQGWEPGTEPKWEQEGKPGARQGLPQGSGQGANKGTGTVSADLNHTPVFRDAEPSNSTPPPTGGRRKKKIPSFVFVLLAIAVVWGLVLMERFAFSVEIPDLTGMSEEEGYELLQGLPVEYTFETVHSHTYEAGIIDSQSQSGFVRKGSTISVYVSDGLLITVPPLDGEPWNWELRSQLEEDFDLNIQYVCWPDGYEPTVLSSGPDLETENEALKGSWLYITVGYPDYTFDYLGVTWEEMCSSLLGCDGSDEAEYQMLAEDLLLCDIQLESSYSDEYEEGTICQLEWTFDSFELPLLTVSVSEGSAFAAMPDLLGLDVGEAEDVIIEIDDENLGVYSYGEDRPFYGPYDAGQIAYQFDQAGSSVDIRGVRTYDVLLSAGNVEHSGSHIDSDVSEITLECGESVTLQFHTSDDVHYCYCRSFGGAGSTFENWSDRKLTATLQAEDTPGQGVFQITVWYDKANIDNGELPVDYVNVYYTVE